MSDSSKDAGMIQTLLERLNTHRLPRALDLKSKVDRGEQLDEYDIEFLKRCSRTPAAPGRWRAGIPNSSHSSLSSSASMARSRVKGSRTSKRPEVTAMKRKKPVQEKANDGESGELKRKDYEKELRQLHIELVKAQQWIVHKGLKICIVFEGRDGAGKGGTIKAITDRLSPRVFASLRYRRRPTARRARCTCSATCRIFPPPVRSSSSTAAGTTAPASSE